MEGSSSENRMEGDLKWKTKNGIRKN